MSKPTNYYEGVFPSEMIDALKKCAQLFPHPINASFVTLRNHRSFDDIEGQPLSIEQVFKIIRGTRDKKSAKFFIEQCQRNPHLIWNPQFDAWAHEYENHNTVQTIIQAITLWALPTILDPNAKFEDKLEASVFIVDARICNDLSAKSDIKDAHYDAKEWVWQLDRVIESFCSDELNKAIRELLISRKDPEKPYAFYSPNVEELMGVAQQHLTEKKSG